MPLECQDSRDRSINKLGKKTREYGCRDFLCRQTVSKTRLVSLHRNMRNRKCKLDSRLRCRSNADVVAVSQMQGSDLG